MDYRLRFRSFALSAWVATLVGCGAAADPSDFVSDNPQSSGGSSGLTSGGTDAGTTDTAGDSGGDPGDDDGDRDILEADIIQIEGDRLYALSEFGGLAVIDVSTPDKLPVLGRYRSHAQPFEMYLDNGQVFVMFSDFGTWDYDAEVGDWDWHQTSRLVALDAQDPANIEVRGEYELPGAIQDSRRVGDVLYLVTYEDGWCWGCKDVPNTTITSLDVTDERAVKLVDQITFEDDVATYGGGPRSVSSTPERLYVAGIDYGAGQDAGSIIDVIDISDPAGKMVKGTGVPIAGQITSRWQMDEHESVLRVVSQPGFWGSTEPPVVETFAVVSSQEVTPLGSLQMQLPRPESLRSVRFDGTRAYAITFEQTDPLFTLDLADPTAPKQIGELEIPGWVYHMEPRGDRILALGFDQGNPEGSINVSLFDVGDFKNPALLSRVHFGEDWASFAEDQNRIHKAFTILDELGLLLVPFSGWSYDDGQCWGSYHSGIQLVDWAGDTLDLRGLAPSHGRARRGFLHGNRLFSVSDKSVETFDISNRDAPVSTAELALAANVGQVTLGDGMLVRLSQDWWNGENLLEVVSSADPENPEPLGRLALNEFTQNAQCWEYGWSDADVFTHDGWIYVLHDIYDEQYGKGSLRIETIDARDPTNLVHVSSETFAFGRGWGGGWLGGIGLQEKRVVQVGAALVVLGREEQWHEGEEYVSRSSFEIIALTDGGKPVHAASVPRPDGIGHGGLMVFDGTVVSWHMRKVDATGSKVRFYLERLGVDNPAAPELAPPVNVPGAVVALDAAGQRATTVDFRFQRVPEPKEGCWSLPKVWDQDYESHECIVVERQLKLVGISGNTATLLDTLDVGQDGSLHGVIASERRLFAHVWHGTWGYYPDGGPVDGPTNEIAIVTGLDDDALVESSRQMVQDSWLWLGSAVASGSRLVFGVDQGLAVLDASDPDAPSLTAHELYGYYCYDLEVIGSAAYCALGEWGLQRLAI